MIIDSKEDNVDTSNIVYHYTSQEGLLSILRNKTLWFTDAQFLSDKGELSIVLDSSLEAKEKVYEETENETKRGLLKEIESYIEYLKQGGNIYENYYKTYPNDGISGIEKERYYILCASKDPDASGLWNYYVKNDNYCGYNIGINLDAIKDVWKQKVSIQYGDVIYDKTEQVNIFYDFISDYIKSCDPKNDGEIEMAKLGLIGKLGLKIDEHKMFFKATAFRDEKEYRFVIEDKTIIEKNQRIEDERILDDSTKREFRLGKSGVPTPYIEWNWGELAPNLIKQISLSPMMEYDLAKESLEQLFFDYNHDGIDIIPSSIKARF